MHTTSSPRPWLHRTIAFAIGAAMVAGCHAGPAGVLSTASNGVLNSAAFVGKGDAVITVNLADDKAAAALGAVKGDPKRSVQSVNLARATTATLYYTGAGIDSWAGGWSKTFGAAVGGTRTITLNATGIPAGPRRVFKLTITDSNAGGALLEEYWGVADIVAGGAAAVVTMNRYTTPTGKIFRKLVTTKDVATAITIPVADVQGFVDKLINTDSATGNALDGTKPQINYSLLNIDMAASAIAVGAGSPPVPYTVPTTIPAAMAPTPQRKGTLRIKAVDVKGQPVTSECVVYVNDWASSVARSTSGSPVDVTFPDVTPGTWTATVVDINSGRTGTGSVSVGEGGSPTYSVMLPIQKLDLAVGAPNLEAGNGGVNYGYNGDNLHPLLTYLNSPYALTINGGILYFVDYGNKRIRSVDVTSNNPVVKTIAGNGQNPVAAAPELSQATQVPVSINSNTSLVTDSHGYLYFNEPAYRRVAKINLATGELSTAVNAASLPSPWYGNPNQLSYDQTSDTLYMTDDYYVRPWAIALAGANAYPATTCLTAVDNTKTWGNGSILRAGNYVFYSFSNQLYRKDMTTGTIDTICGKTTTYQNGNGVPAQQFYTYGYGNMQVDALGNLYFTNGSVYRVTNALSGTDANNTWLVNNLGFNANGFVVDGASGNFYASGSFAMPDPTGYYYWSSANISAINVVRP